MPTVITPSPALLPATINGPQDLVDLRTAASVNQAFQPLADACGYYQESITVRRIIACADACSRGSDDTAAATWDPSSFATQWAPTQDDATSALVRVEMYTDVGRIRFVTANAGSALAKHVLFPLNAYVIHEGTFVDVVLRLQGNAGHCGLPANMPTLGIARYDPAANTWASLVAAGATADTSVDVAAYEALHTITATVDQNATIDREQYVYYAVVANEAGANALGQLALVSLRVRMTARRFST